MTSTNQTPSSKKDGTRKREAYNGDVVTVCFTFEAAVRFSEEMVAGGHDGEWVEYDFTGFPEEQAKWDAFQDARRAAQAAQEPWFAEDWSNQPTETNTWAPEPDFSFNGDF